MKLPRWKGTRPGTYVFTLVCFVVGYGLVAILSLGRIAYDDREGPGLNPLSRLPDGRVGLSEFALDVIGFCFLCLCGALFAATGSSVRNPQPWTFPAEITIKSRSDHLQIRP